MSADRPPKRIKLTEKLKASNAAKRSLPHMSQSAFTGFVKYVKEHDISLLAQRRHTLSEARDASLEATPYGPMMVSSALFGTPPHPNRELWMINPFAYLYLCYKRGGGFYETTRKHLEANPSSHCKPWRLVLYSDEVVSGNNLAMVNNRKVWVIYWSFLEFGYLLSDEDAWVPMVAEPSRPLKKNSAGISQVFCKAIQLFFGGGEGHHDFRAGIRLDGHVDQESVRFFAILSMFLRDGGAQKLVWGCKGDGVHGLACSAKRWCRHQADLHQLIPTLWTTGHQKS